MSYTEWNVDNGMINLFRGVKFQLVGGREAEIYEVAVCTPEDLYYIIINMPNGRYLTLEYTSKQFLIPSYDIVLRAIHDDILDVTGGNREILNSKLHKSLYGN